MARPRPRRLINAVTALLVLICAATSTAWLRSMRVDDLWLRHADTGVPTGMAYPLPTYAVELNRGFLSYTESRSLAIFSDQPRGWHHFSLRAQRWMIGGADRRTGGGSLSLWNQLGFSMVSAGQIWSVTIPCWLLVAASGALPGVRGYRALAGWWRRWRLERRLRRNRGICAGCGYDLRATPERCPECGLKVVEK